MSDVTSQSAVPDISQARMRTVLRAFGGARMAVGALSWVAPTSAARVFGLDPRSKQPVITQLFGARDFALGFLTATSSGTSLEQVLRVGVMLDSADTVASVRQVRAGTLSIHGIFGVGVGAATFAAIGVAALVGGKESAEASAS